MLMLITIKEIIYFFGVEYERLNSKELLTLVGRFCIELLVS